MSRSKAKKYRITNIDSRMKRKANKAVRINLDVPSGTYYKRLFESWKICDGGKPQYMNKSDFWYDEASRK
jgi:hypothetical protein